MQPRILIIDDDPDFVETYTDLLASDGYEVTVANSASQARLQLKGSRRWDVVLLDKHLQGEGKPADGLDLIPLFRLEAPEAKVILVTAYADDASIRMAFEYGAYDYLEKNQLFQPLLRAKLRNAVELAESRRLAATDGLGREILLRESWANARAESNRNKKGRYLEQTLVALFSTIPGLVVAAVNAQNRMEEIDVVVRNDSTDLFMHRQGDFILVECKNWSKPADRKEFDAFGMKLQRRGNRSRLGLFISRSGVTEAFRLALMAEARQDYIIRVLDEAGLGEWIAAEDRIEHLKRLVQAAAFGTQDT